MTTATPTCAPRASDSTVAEHPRHALVRRALIVVTGDDVYEDLFTGALELQRLLLEAGFVARVAVGTAWLRTEPDADERLVVLCTAAGSFDTVAQQTLERRVEAGLGLIAVHASNVLPADASLADLIGSRYGSHGPPPHESRYRVELEGHHEVTRGIGQFEITHEHYVLEVRAPVRAVAWRGTGHGREPLVHVRQKGEGRVCYIQFGHDMRSWGEPGVRQVVRQAALWASGEAS